MQYRLLSLVLFLTTTFIPNVYPQHGSSQSNGKEYVYLVLPGIEDDVAAQNVEKVKAALSCRGEMLKNGKGCFTKLTGSSPRRNKEKIMVFYDYDPKDNKTVIDQHLGLSYSLTNGDGRQTPRDTYCKINFNVDTHEQAYGKLIGELSLYENCKGSSDITATIHVFHKFYGSDIPNAAGLAPNIYVGPEGEVYVNKFAIRDLEKDKYVTRNYYAVRVK